MVKGWKQRHFRLERLDDAEGGACVRGAFELLPLLSRVRPGRATLLTARRRRGGPKRKPLVSHRLARLGDVGMHFPAGWVLAYFVDARPGAERKGALRLSGARVELPAPDADDDVSFAIVEGAAAAAGEAAGGGGDGGGKEIPPRALRAASGAARARWVALVETIAEGRRGEADVCVAPSGMVTLIASEDIPILTRHDAASPQAKPISRSPGPRPPRSPRSTPRSPRCAPRSGRSS